MTRRLTIDEIKLKSVDWGFKLLSTKYEKCIKEIKEFVKNEQNTVNN